MPKPLLESLTDLIEKNETAKIKLASLIGNSATTMSEVLSFYKALYRERRINYRKEWLARAEAMLDDVRTGRTSNTTYCVTDNESY